MDWFFFRTGTLRIAVDCSFTAAATPLYLCADNLKHNKKMMEGAEKRRLKPSNRRAEFGLCFLCVHDGFKKIMPEPRARQSVSG